MNCNDGLHGALYYTVDKKWVCMVCKKTIDYSTLSILRSRKERKEQIMPKDIRAFGSKVIVERKDKEDDGKGFKVVGMENNFHSGKIISIGSLIATDLFSDQNAELKVGAYIVYSTKAKSLGLDFPDSFDVVEAEDIVGLVVQKEEENE